MPSKRSPQDTSYLLNFLQLIVLKASIRLLSWYLAGNFVHFVAEVLSASEIQTTRVMEYPYARQLDGL